MVLVVSSSDFLIGPFHFMDKLPSFLIDGAIFLIVRAPPIDLLRNSTRMESRGSFSYLSLITFMNIAMSSSKNYSFLYRLLTLFSLDSPVDYRMYHLENSKNDINSLASELAEENVFYPLGEESTKKVDNIFEKLAGSLDLEDIQLEPFPGRHMFVKGQAVVGRMHFETYFKGNFGSSDY